MEIIIGIYKITNPKGKYYIGKSKNIYLRFVHYKTVNCKEQRKIYNSLKKYGPENHIFEVIEVCEEEQLNEKEIFWIKELNSVSIGLNLTYGGDGGNFSNESIELSRLNRIKPIIKFDLEGNFIKKYKSASEAIKEIGKGNSNNINDCARGKYKSTYGFQWKYEKDIMGDIIKIDPIKIIPRFNKTHTDESKLKMSLSKKGKKKSKEYSEKIKKLKQKTVYQIDKNNNIIKIFPSFKSMNKSGIIGTKKLRKILNKDEYYNGYRYSYHKPNIVC